MSYDLQIVNGDFSIKNGQIATVVDTDKLAQDVLKICVTPNGTNPLQPWYGSFLSKTMVGSPLPDDAVLQMARVQLENCIQNLKTLQQMQARSLQRVSAYEQINSILLITVKRNPNDYRLFTVNVSVLSKGFTPLNSAFTVSTI